MQWDKLGTCVFQPGFVLVLVPAVVKAVQGK